MSPRDQLILNRVVGSLASSPAERGHLEDSDTCRSILRFPPHPLFWRQPLLKRSIHQYVSRHDFINKATHATTRSPSYPIIRKTAEADKRYIADLRCNERNLIGCTFKTVGHISCMAATLCPTRVVSKFLGGVPDKSGRPRQGHKEDDSSPMNFPSLALVLSSSH